MIKNEKNDESNCLIFILPKDFSENVSYHDAIFWAFSNLDNEDVVRISMEDVYLIPNILDIINDENESMFGPWEDGRIGSKQAKLYFW